MKKILKLLTVLLTVTLILTACSREKTKVFTQTHDQQNNEITIYYKGDLVNRIVNVSTINELGADKDAAIKSIKESIKEHYGDIEGLTYEFEEKDDKLIMKSVLNYTKIDYDKAKAKLSFNKASLDEERKLSNVEKRIIDNNGKEKK